MEPLVHLISCYMLCLATGIFEQQRILRDREEIVRFPWFELKARRWACLELDVSTYSPHGSWLWDESASL